MTIAVLQRFVPHDGTAWELAIAALDEIVGEALDQGLTEPARSLPAAIDLLADGVDGPSGAIADLMASSIGFARLLGRRTAELHAALARVDGRPAIAPEPFTEQAQRSRWTSGRWQRRYRIANSRCSRDSAGCWHGH